MRKNTINACIRMAVCIMMCFPARAQSWVSVGNAGLSDSVVSFLKLAIDKSGTPYVVYQDVANSLKATVKKYNGSSWVTVGSAGFSAGTAAFTSIAIDKDGIPYVAFSDEANGWGASVMKYNGTSWATVGSVNFSAGTAAYTSIAIDTSGIPYVVYMNGCCLDLACSVMKFNGSSWVAVGGSFTSNAVNGLSMALNPAGIPYVAYEDGENSAASALKFDGSSWAPVGMLLFTETWSINVSIAIDGNGTPYVASSDMGNAANASVMKYNGSNWVGVGSTDLSPGYADYTTIAIDPGGTPYVFYEDVDTNSTGHGPATAMKFNGSSWITVGSRGFSAGDINSAAIAIDTSGTPYVAYQDVPNGNKATVMKFGYATAVKNITAHASSLTIFPNPTQRTFTINLSSTSNETVTISITNTLGVTIKQCTISTNTDTPFRLDASPGIYFISAATGNGIINEKLVIE